jgi:hypothetical protein
MVLRRSFQLQNSRRKAESKVTCYGINGFSRSRPSSVPEGVITSSLLCLQNWNVTELIGYHNGSGLQRFDCFNVIHMFQRQVGRLSGKWL